MAVAVAERREPTRGRSGGRAWLELAGLSALAFAQPIFDALDRNPDAYARVGAQPLDLVVMVLALVLVPPTVLLAVEWVVARVARRGAAVLHALLVAGLAALVAWQALIEFDVRPGALRAAVALGLLALLAVAYLRLRFLRELARVLAIAAPVTAAVFVFGAPVGPGSGSPEPLADEPPRRPVPVVVAVFDELPLATLLDGDGEVDARLFPAFARLARDGTWYPGARTVSDLTAQAVPALVTGRLPSGATPLAENYPQTLFTLIGGRYDARVSESMTALCPRSVCAARESLPDRVLDLAYLGADNAVITPLELPARLLGALSGSPSFLPDPKPQLEEFLGRVEGPAANDLFYVHLQNPHVPWRYLPDGRSYPHWLQGNTWFDSRPLSQLGLQQHLLQAQFADRQLGQLLARLRGEGIYERALVIVASDHGASFVPSASRRALERSNAGSIAPVALFVKYPGQERGRVDRRHARTVDLLPTVADVLGVRVPWEVEGRSLAAPPPPQPRRETFASATASSLTLPSRLIDAQLRSAARRQARLLRSGSAWALGLPPGVYGRPVAQVRSRLAPVSAVTIGPPDGLVTDEMSPPTVPAFVAADAPMPLPPQTLLLAARGRIVAPAFPMTGGRAGAMISPRFLARLPARGTLYRLRGAPRR